MKKETNTRIAAHNRWKQRTSGETPKTFLPDIEAAVIIFVVTADMSWAGIGASIKGAKQDLDSERHGFLGTSDNYC